MMLTPDRIEALIAGFDVRNNPVFLPGVLLVPFEQMPGARDTIVWAGAKYVPLRYTRCNGYAGVLLTGMGCPIPATMTANQLHDYFGSREGMAAGWRPCDVHEAARRANQVYPVVVTAHEDPHGHIGVGRPNAADPLRLYVTAAGAYNTQKQLWSDQFAHLAPVSRFWTRD